MVSFEEATTTNTMNHITMTSFKRVKSPEEVVMDYELSKSYKDEWSGERSWADTIMANMRRVGLSFQLDKLTRGNGSCLMIAVLQQLKRPELYSQLAEPVKQMVDSLDHHSFRWFVKKKAEAFKVSSLYIGLPSND